MPFTCHLCVVDATLKFGCCNFNTDIRNYGNNFYIDFESGYCLFLSSVKNWTPMGI